jgi:hypothetical protein
MVHRVFAVLVITLVAACTAAVEAPGPAAPPAHSPVRVSTDACNQDNDCQGEVPDMLGGCPGGGTAVNKRWTCVGTRCMPVADCR